MPPVAAAIAAIGSAIGATISAIAAFTIGGISVGAFALKLAFSVALNFVVSAIFKPKSQGVAERQASVLQLSIGEGPAEALFGRVSTGGTLGDVFNYGDENEWEVMVIPVADHECDGFEGFWVGDKFYDAAADGNHPHADFWDGSTPCLQIFWRSGTLTQSVPSILTTNDPRSAPLKWEATDHGRGRAYFVVAYRFNEKVWPQGRPRFVWLLRGLKLYDPRKDSTVEGGSGPHRWDTQSTHEWSENAKLCEYYYQRGVWTNGQLMVGPGRTIDEAPPEDAIAAANICDEDVALKAGGTEKKYTASAVIRANEPWIAVLEEFADAMAGELIERNGAIFVEPGAAKPIVATMTDDDLIDGATIDVQRFVARDRLINTVRCTYIARDKLYREHSAPLRRSLDDITADGEPREAPLELGYVGGAGVAGQAQRCAEIARRKARRQRQAQVTLGPRFLGLEVGDWIAWQSARYFGGSVVTFRVEALEFSADARIVLGLREISSGVYAWNPATDELDATAPAYLPPGAPTSPAIADFDAAYASVDGVSGAQPSILCVYSPPTDERIVQIRFEYRQDGGGAVLAKVEARPFSGTTQISEGLVDGDWEVRAVPVTSPAMIVTATSWRPVTVGAQIVGEALTTPWSGVTDDDGHRPADDADVTADNVAAAIDGQGDLATESEVTTALIAANAVTDVAGVYTAGSVSVGVGVWTTVASLSITLQAAPVKIDFGLFASSSVQDYRVLEDGVSILQIGGSGVPRLVAFPFMHLPAAGAHVYELQARAVGSTGSAEMRSLTMLGVKR